MLNSIHPGGQAGVGGVVGSVPRDFSYCPRGT